MVNVTALMVRLRFASISHSFSTVAARLRRVPSKYKSQAIEEAQKAITDYLRTTRSLSYTHAEHIATNASVSIRNLISQIDFTASNFSRSLRKHLSYNPINEFEFFLESIGIEYNEVSDYLPEKRFFFDEDRAVLDAACALSGFGFPWNNLGKLYKDESLIFSQSPEEIRSRLLMLKDLGFTTLAVIGICLAIPRSLLGGDDEIRCLFVKLKKLFQEFEDVDSWYAISKKVRVFYDLCRREDDDDEEMWELMGRSKSLLTEYSEEALMEKTEFFSRFGVGTFDAALLILRYPVIMSFDLERPMFSVSETLKRFGLSQGEVDAVALRYPYVFGRNKLKNLPYVVRALDLHERIFDILKNGNHCLLAEPADEEGGLDREYKEGLEEIERSRTKAHTFQKLDFLHEIGFGENGMTMKVLQHVHGTAPELQDRFKILLSNGIELSKICMLIRSAPKILNQKPDSIQDKLSFLGDSLEQLEIFPAYLCYDLECRISPRFRFHKWLVEKGLSDKAYSIASIVATSEKAFVARLYGIHPAIPKHWFERFSCRKVRSTV